jgi:transcriptional regulator GlxA family with amidase domain
MPRTIHFGALVYGYQATDVLGPLDLLHCSSHELLSQFKSYIAVSDEALANAPNFVFHHIGETMDPVKISNILPIQPTTTIDDCPELDCLLLGGPMELDFVLSPRFAEFVRQHVEKGKLLFTNCTGSLPAAMAGVLDGKNATINNLAYRSVRQFFPNVKWTDETKWVVDGNIWTAGGAIAGMDMFSHWMQQEFGMEVLAAGSKGMDFEPRDVHGVLNVLPKRYNADGKQLFTHSFD